MSSIKPENTVENWYVEATHPLPNLPSIDEAYIKLASPSKWIEWRSSDFAKGKNTALDGAKEPFKQSNKNQVKLGPITITIEYTEVTKTSDELIIDTIGTAFFGFMKSRLRFHIYKDLQTGKFVGKAQENPTSMKWIFPSPKKIEMEHVTMFKELDALYAIKE